MPKTKSTSKQANVDKANKTKYMTDSRRLSARTSMRSVDSDIRRQRLTQIYAVASVCILFGTTMFWAVLGARIQRSNADQLVNGLLFEHIATFRAASFPGAHTMLLKWPLFLLIRLLGNSASIVTTLTVGSVLATVGALAFMLYKIDRRPLVFGTLCLALASVLLLVPAQPYAGGILPVNMAMLATRNLEYVLYIGGLVLLTRSSKRIRSWLLALLAFGLLFASDKLFFTIAIGGAALMFVVYAMARRWQQLRQAVYWAIITLVALALALGLLWLVNINNLTHITTQSSTGPYGVVQNAHNLALGIVYGVLGVLTNFGANPAFSATIVRNIPHVAWHELRTVSGVTYVVNGLILLTGLIAGARLFVASLRRPKAKQVLLDRPTLLSLMLLFSTAAAFMAFVLSNHYYAVDARYLTIALFAIFISLATVLRSQKQLKDGLLVTAGLILIVVIGVGVPGALRSYRASQTALNETNKRNSLVAEVMSHHLANVLVGDYWRVVPIKSLMPKLKIMPLADCTTPRTILSSQNWQTNVNNHKFAYLLSLDGGLTDYPHCTLNQIIQAYGRPNTSTLIAGSLNNPKELILFYDEGAHKSGPKAPLILLKIPSTVLPVPISELPNVTCPSSTTVMNVVAHQDDDLLFMNPDLLKSIQAGDCVRTVYVTAGDSGSSQLYWLSREQGSEAAYSEMAGTSSIWVQRLVELASQEYVTIASPQGNPKLSLVFMRLPDGNIHGEGFADSHYESLAKLTSGQISTMRSVDGQSVYSSAQLTTALTTLMQTFKPTLIRTQSPVNLSAIYPDHSDHLAVGGFTQHARQQYDDGQADVPINYYIGYPIHQMAQNIWGSDLTAKENAWLAYARFDSAVCQSVEICENTATYNAYLTRQYQYHPN